MSEQVQADEGGPRATLVEVLMRQREAWRKRLSRPAVEDLLREYPYLAGDADAVLDLIYNETVLREEAGLAVRPADYLRRFPHLADELRLQFEVDEALSEDGAAPASPGGSTVLTPVQPDE